MLDNYLLKEFMPNVQQLQTETETVSLLMSLTD